MELPSGTVTFLFTDIEGSTRLLKQLGDRYADALAHHQRILRECFAAHRGREIDTQGDSFFVAFARAGDAVASAIAAQLALQSQAWPDGAQVRVRMGLHSGEPQATGERYVGFGVHRAARVGAVGHGGQILVSSATRALVEDDLPPHTALRDLGVYRLKDVERPEHLFQVDGEGLQRDFAPLAAPRVGGPSRARRLVVGAVVLAAAAALALAAYARVTEGPAVGSADNPITIVAGLADDENDPERKAFLEVLRTFEDTTGLHTELVPLDVSDPSEIPGRLESGQGMVALIGAPGVLAEIARSGTAKPLASLRIPDTDLRRSFSKAWVDLAGVDGKTYGVPMTAGSKSLVWYRPADLKRMGLRPPRTWAELVALTRSIKRAGETPWALSAADGWTLTDWFENVYLHSAGPYLYDALFAGKLPFDDPSVLRALRRITTLLSEDHIAGGRSGALALSFADAIYSVFGMGPRAHLLMEGGFVGVNALAYVRPRPTPGRTIAAMPFPRIDRRVGNPVVVGGGFMVPLADDEAIRRLLVYLSSPGAARIWVTTGATVSPHKAVRYTAYPTLIRAEARQVTTAEAVRFDGSDLLPGTLGYELGKALQDVVAQPERASAVMAAFQRKVARVFELD